MKHTAEFYRPLIVAIADRIAEFSTLGWREFSADAPAEVKKTILKAVQEGRGRFEFRLSFEPLSVVLMVVPVDEGAGDPFKIFGFEFEPPGERDKDLLN